MGSFLIRNVALSFGAIILAAVFTTLPAYADADKNNPAISEVLVDFANTSFGSTLTINGLNLLGEPGKEETTVVLGERGELQILSGTDTQLRVRCFIPGTRTPEFDCDDGDYKLVVTIDEVGESQKGQKGRATYDLTIGAVGPIGPQGVRGTDGTDGAPGGSVSCPCFDAAEILVSDIPDGGGCIFSRTTLSGGEYKAPGV